MYLLIVLFLLNFFLCRRLSTAHSWQKSVSVRPCALVPILAESTDLRKKREVSAAQRCRIRVLGLCFHILNAAVFIAALICRFALAARKILPLSLGGVRMTTFGQLLGFLLMLLVFLAEVLCMVGGFLREDCGSRGANIAVRTAVSMMMLLVAGAGILIFCFLIQVKTA